MRRCLMLLVMLVVLLTTSIEVCATEPSDFWGDAVISLERDISNISRYLEEKSFQDGDYSIYWFEIFENEVELLFEDTELFKQLLAPDITGSSCASNTLTADSEFVIQTVIRIHFHSHDVYGNRFLVSESDIQEVYAAYSQYSNGECTLYDKDFYYIELSLKLLKNAPQWHNLVNGLNAN